MKNNGYLPRTLGGKVGGKNGNGTILATIINCPLLLVLSSSIYMPGRYYDVDEEGNIIDPRIVGYTSSYNRDQDEHENRYESESRYSSNYSRGRSRSRHRSPSRHSETVKRPWIVPKNPLLRSGESDEESSGSDHEGKHRHRHRHRHHHRHHSRSRSSSRSRFRQNSYKSNTPADRTDHWGHELYIEKVILNPDPEPPRSRSSYEPPKEKWISKAGGVAIFTSRPTSASSYQGRYDL